jgi:hypothetical protein
MAAQFSDVKTILDKIVADWTTAAGGAPQFSAAGNHGSAFLWQTAAQLLASSARGLPMIQPAIIGQPGMGHTANIVLALTVGAPKPGGGPSYPPMPDGGLKLDNNFLALASPEIQTIISWIEGGCLP